jgi:hypothetical protein
MPPKDRSKSYWELQQISHLTYKNYILLQQNFHINFFKSKVIKKYVNNKYFARGGYNKNSWQLQQK